MKTLSMIEGRARAGASVGGMVLVIALSACSPGTPSGTGGAATGSEAEAGAGAGATAAASTAMHIVPVTVRTAHGNHIFLVEGARTAAQQEQGLMYRTDLKPDSGMLFAPYPVGGGAPVAANFWMKNTPSPLDIVFIRADGTIARIAENAIPQSEAMIPSGEPVAAVLEIPGGRSAELGISEGDSVTWPRGL